jgi:tol-pal system beta propeller repeat protein TolB
MLLRQPVCLALLLATLTLALPQAALAGPPPARVFCSASPECGQGFHCFWGVCISDLETPRFTLFRMVVGPIMDLRPTATGAGAMLKLEKAIAGQLASTGFIDANPIPAGDLGNQSLELVNLGYAYRLEGRLSTGSDGKNRLDLWVLDLLTEGRIAALDGSVALPSVDDPSPVLAFVNRLTGYFTGRPGYAGTRIACVRKGAWGVKEVTIMDPATGNEKALTSDGKLAVLPAWTADGRVAYTSFKSGEAWLYIQGREQPFSSASTMVTGVAWSPDSSVAAATLVTDGNPDIWLLEGTTGEARARLTDHRAIDTSPTWSPDGRRIAFVSDRSGGGPQIFLMDDNGDNQERLTYGSSYNTSPAWHPFSDHIAYVARQGGFHIFMLSLVDQQQRQITFPPGEQEDPAWTPDGRSIVYVQARRGHRDLYIMNADGSDRRRVNTQDGNYFSPVWEPLKP